MRFSLCFDSDIYFLSFFFYHCYFLLQESRNISRDNGGGPTYEGVCVCVCVRVRVGVCVCVFEHHVLNICKPEGLNNCGE